MVSENLRNNIKIKTLRVRDQAILQLLGTDFPRVIGSKKHENVTNGIFSAIFDSMVLGYSGIDNSNI